MVSFALVIPRSEHVEVILGRLKSFPAVAILGPRQIGKTTLARQVARRAAHTGAELDLLLPRGRRRVGIEIKRTAAPKATRSVRTAIDDLNLQEVVVIHAGRESYRLAANVRTVAASRLDADLGL